ncbi:ExbD/TolR family protein [Hydrocarboniclastica marina]|uniref:Biopolymer transporter ExbD n=1 Tax=Hydrocarboniclastica marina TaxID=2259620 RepID=A0A4P7XHR1_9ALTE|nr:biopolymer transporter ExbD [Hydrocarboniclastica marina]MAL98966.1 biopolymer transporter ExbD [Alteromonadaceae bacterium]QCF26315.1 biopolymer transporter ExbD [Hydrocarboniclastica marina]
MKFKRQSTEEMSINLTPLIDVVFLLLIFFMVSTTFTRESHLEIVLPEADAEAAEIQADQVDVVITASGDISVNGRPLVDNDAQTLRRAVAEVTEGNNELPFIITADAQTAHELVVRAMDVAGRLGFSKLSITTTRSPRD